MKYIKHFKDSTERINEGLSKKSYIYDFNNQTYTWSKTKKFFDI